MRSDSATLLPNPGGLSVSSLLVNNSKLFCSYWRFSSLGSFDFTVDHAKRQLQTLQMKFGKTYTEYKERETFNRLSGCSYVEFKRLKKVLKRCPLHDLPCSSSIPTSSCALIPSQPSDCSALRAFECRSAERDVPQALTTTQCPSSCPGIDIQACLACHSEVVVLKCSTFLFLHRSQRSHWGRVAAVSTDECT